MNKTQSLQSHIESLVEAGGARLVELTLRPQGRRRVLEVFVDTEEGITADLLAELSRTIGKAVEENGWITDAYQLVVSSPGLERPLRFAWQYRRHLGRTVRLSLRDGDATQGETTQSETTQSEIRNGDATNGEATHEVEGRILEATDEQLLISDGEGALPVPHDRIVQANIIAVL